jgi:hypothetical protein
MDSAGPPWFAAKFTAGKIGPKSAGLGGGPAGLRIAERRLGV